MQQTVEMSSNCYFRWVSLWNLLTFFGLSFGLKNLLIKMNLFRNSGQRTAQSFGLNSVRSVFSLKHIAKLDNTKVVQKFIILSCGYLQYF